MNARRMLLVNIIVIFVIIVAGFVGYYFYNQSTLYLKTNDAEITGKQIIISAPSAGKLADWTGTFGTQFQSGKSLGNVETVQGGKVVDVPINAPTDGTIVQDNALNNEFVAPGTPLAYAYEMNSLWVTANIKETDINDVKVGQQVDVYVDAEPGVTYKGTVDSIGLATASTFSLLPDQSTTADYTKVTQVIPVKITIQGGSSVGLVPGMSAEVRIHK